MVRGAHALIVSAVTNAVYCSPKNSYVELNGGSLRLLCAGREQCLPEYRVQRTEFNCALIEFVSEGRGHLSVNGEVADLYPGMLFCYGVDAPHELWSDPDSPMTKYFVAFQSAGRSVSVNGIDVLEHGIRWTRDLTTVQLAFDELIRSGQGDGKLASALTAQLLKLLLLKSSEALPRPSHNRFQRRSRRL